MNPPLVVGHRGAPGYRPELTRSSLLLAVEQGAQALEVDVVPTSDGALAVRHEPALRATTDVSDRPEFAGRARRAAGGRREWFAEDFTGAELSSLRARERLPATRPASAQHDGREPVLLLPEVLSIAAAAGVLLVLEIKDALRGADLRLDPAPLVARDLALAPRLPRIVLESFEKTPLLALARLGHPLVYLLEGVGTAPDERRRGAAGRPYRAELAACDFAGFTGVSLPLALLTPERVESLHRRGLQVWGWTMRTENRFLPAAYRSRGGADAPGDWRTYWNAVLDSGPDAVFVDQPDLLVGLLGARTPHHVRA